MGVRRIGSATTAMAGFAAASMLLVACGGSDEGGTGGSTGAASGGSDCAAYESYKAFGDVQGKTVSSFLGVEPMELDFLWVDLGTPSEARTITLTNQSDKAMRVSLLENTNPAFVVNADALGAELAPGEQAQLHVTFLSNTGGEATGELRLALNSNSTADVAIKLKGQSRTLQGEGGGCACGAGGGGASLLGLLGLVALRARRRSRAD